MCAHLLKVVDVVSGGVVGPCASVLLQFQRPGVALLLCMYFTYVGVTESVCVPVDCQKVSECGSDSFTTQETVCHGWPICGTAHGIN